MATESPFIREAKKYEPKIRKALIRAFNELRTQETRAAVEKALVEGGIDAVMRMFDNISPKIAATLGPLLDEAIQAGSGLPLEMIPAGALAADATISLFNRYTVDFLERYKLNLIQTISSNTREAIRNSLIADSVAGRNPRETARNFRNSIGLTPKQEQSVRNYKSYLENLDRAALERKLRDRRSDSVIERAIRDQKPMTPEQIDKMTNRYRERYIKYRAEVIARTESMRATSVGNRAAIDVLINEGQVDVNIVRRFWVYVKDNRTREPHTKVPSMNPNGVKLDEPYKTPLGPLLFPRDPSGTAENTVQCRCVERYKLINEEGK